MNWRTPVQKEFTDIIEIYFNMSEPNRSTIRTNMPHSRVHIHLSKWLATQEGNKEDNRPPTIGNDYVIALYFNPDNDTVVEERSDVGNQDVVKSFVKETLSFVEKGYIQLLPLR